MKRQLFSLLVLFVSLTSTGCLAVEKKTLVLVVPPNSKEIHCYHVFEGISVAEQKDATLARAKAEINALKEPHFSFFGINIEKGSPLSDICRFEKTRFFVHPNPTQKRPLCMDRRFTITDRDAFAKLANQNLSAELNKNFQENSDEKFQQEIKKARADLEKEAALGSMGPFLKAVTGLLDLTDELDLASIKKLRSSAKDGFRWIRIEPSQIHLAIATTPAYAKRVVSSPLAKDWLKGMRSFVEPIDLRANDEGLLIVLGKQGKAIRFRHEDKRAIRVEDENALAAHAEPASLIVLEGQAMTAEKLIDRFLKEKLQSK
jgi:hypothetical protein